jgi:hypothetical protein
MKKVLILFVLISVSAIVSGEEPWPPDLVQKDYPGKVNRNKRPVSKASTFPRWAFHSNLLGFVQFGPVVTAEYNISRSLSFSAHTRFSSLGALTPTLHQADVDRGGRPDDFSGIAFGGGPLWYLKTRKDKVYVGLLFEYEMSDALYQQDYVNEWNQENRKMILMLNSGYRFRFAQKLIPGQHRPFDKFLREALFLNTGICAGAERNEFNWDYTDPESIGADDTTPRSGREIKPFGMLEVAVGIEF